MSRDAALGDLPDQGTMTVNAYPWPGMTIRTAVLELLKPGDGE